MGFFFQSDVYQQAITSSLFFLIIVNKYIKWEFFFSNIFMACILKVSSYLSFIPLMCSKKSFIHIMFCCIEILNLENSFMGRHKIWFNIIIWLKLARCPALIAWVSRSDTRSGSNTRWNLYCTMERYISRTLNLIWYFQTELLFDIPKLNYSFL